MTYDSGCLRPSSPTFTNMPAIYPSRFFAAGGGLMSYGSDLVELMRLAATYVDRILRGATPHDLPVESSTSSSW